MNLVAVKSCLAHKGSHIPILMTWGRELEVRGFELRFFIGGIAQQGLMGRHEVLVGAPDDYAGLSYKVLRILEWCEANGVDNVFLCDTDTYVDARKLYEAWREFTTGELKDYVGFTGMNGVHGPPHGGPGYWLSRRAVSCALQAFRAGKGDALVKFKQDEWMVSYLLEGVIESRHDDRYSLLTVPSKSHDCITWHDKRLRDDPSFLVECHRKAGY